MGTAQQRGVKGFASLVLPSSFTLATGTTYAVTFSPQTTTQTWNMYGMSVPTGWPRRNGPWRLLLQRRHLVEPWVPVQRLVPSASATPSASCGTGTRRGRRCRSDTRPQPRPIMLSGIPRPPSSDLQSPTMGTSSSTASRAYRCACRPASDVDEWPSIWSTSAFTQPLFPPASSLRPGRPCKTVAQSAGALANGAATFVTVPVPWSLWVLTYTASAPYYFLGITFTGFRANQAQLGVARQGGTTVTLDTWTITGVGGAFDDRESGWWWWGRQHARATDAPIHQSTI